MRLRIFSAMLLCCVAAACSKSCGDDASSTSNDGGAGASLEAGIPTVAASVDAGVAPGVGGASIYSLPIAAAHDPVAARSFIAGLRAAEKAITLTLVDARGAELFRTDVFTGVGWSADAELRVYAAAHGAWVVWRGLVDGGRSQRAVFVNDDGQLAAGNTEVAPAQCAIGETLSTITNAALALVSPDGGGRRLWVSDPSADFSLMCDDGRVLLMSESENGVFVEMPGDTTLMRRFLAFDAESDGRTTALYSHGENAGIVRIAGTQASVRELTDGGLSRTRTRKLSIDEDDDIVVVDAVGTGPLLVTTHDPESACDGGLTLAPRVSAALVPRISGATDGGADAAINMEGGAQITASALTDLAQPVCGRERGPFWSGAVGPDVVVAWGERIRQAGKTTAPVAGVGFARILADGTIADRGVIDVSADGIVDASCDAKDCYVAALVRPPGVDDRNPESVRVFPLRTSRGQ